MRRPSVIMAAAFCPALSFAEAPPSAATPAESFVSGDTAALWAAMDGPLQALIGNESALADLRAGLIAAAGTETAVLSEEESRSPLGTIHDRISAWDGLPGVPILIQTVTDASGRISGFWVGAAPAPAESAYLDHEISADLRLPVAVPQAGEWLVFWGGRSLTQNYHAIDPAQRFALDLVVLQNGATHDGPAEDLTAYHCWGEPILAPAAGLVAAAIDGLSDQAIGATDAANPAGNHVVIEAGPEEFVFLAHLQEGSVTVAEGGSVVAGETVGLCGNSGNSSEPHLHVHLQTTPDLATGAGLPAQFTHYLADGAPVARGEPVRGQTIAPQQ